MLYQRGFDNGHEYIDGLFYMSSNEWSVNDYPAGLRGGNCKGMAVHLVVSEQAGIHPKDAGQIAPGNIVTIDGASGGSSTSYRAMGILLSDVVIGDSLDDRDFRMVSVRMYGWCDRIIVRDGFDANSILMGAARESGEIRGFTRAQLAGPYALMAGVYLKDGLAQTFDLTGVAPGWLVAPGYDPTISPLTLQSEILIGMHIAGDPALDTPETLNGEVYNFNTGLPAAWPKYTRGFVNCLGSLPGRI